MKPLLILSFVTIFCSPLLAQDDYRETSFKISGFVGYAPPLLNPRSRLNYPFLNDDVRIFYKPSSLPPELGLTFDMPINSVVDLSIQTSGRGLQNCGFIRETSTYDNNTNYFTTLTDSIQIGTNVLNFAAFAKGHYEEYDYNLYVLFGTGVSAVFSTVYPTYTKLDSEYNGPNEIVTTKKTEQGSYNSFQFRVSAGAGYSFQTESNMFFDFGVRSSYFIGKREVEQPRDEMNNQITDYKSYSNSILNYIQLTNLQSSYILEFYAKIGFSF